MNILRSMFFFSLEEIKFYFEVSATFLCSKRDDLNNYLLKIIHKTTNLILRWICNWFHLKPKHFLKQGKKIKLLL